jgi:uncharacterized protein
MPETILHYPTLKTVMMVEDTIRKADVVISKNELKRRLPVKIMHQTLKLILEYLENSGKIMIGPKGISWLQQDNAKLKAMLTKEFKMLNKENIIQKIEENRKKIKSFGVKKLALMGSYASGSSKDKSDIDFLVEFEKGRGLFDDYVHLLQFLRDLFGKKIDLGEKRLLREEIKSNILGGKKIEAKL